MLIQSRVLNDADRMPLAIACGIVLILLIPVGFFLFSASVSLSALSENSVRYVLPFAIRDSIMLCLGVFGLAVIVGVGLASVVTYIKFPGSRLIASTAILPLAYPAYLMSYILVEIDRSSDAVKRSGFLHSVWDGLAVALPDLRSMTGAILIFSLVLYPYIFIGTRIAFVSQGGALIEAARSLGRAPIDIYRLILLPVAFPAIAAGGLLVVMECLNDIGASEYLGLRTLAFTIYTTWLNRGDFAAAVQLSLLLMVFVVGLSWAVNIISKRYALIQTRRGATPIKPFHVNIFVGWGIFILAALPISLGFFLPTLFLIDHAILNYAHHLDLVELRNAGFDSFKLAIYASMIVVFIAVVLLYPHRLRSDSMTRAIIRLASYGYGVPGVILGLAILVPFGVLDNALNDVVAAFFGFDIGLAVTGSAAILIFAYLVRFLAVGLGVVGAGYDKISRHLDFAARILGRNRLKSFIMVPTRLNLAAIGAAFLLVFVDTVKELPLTLILRPLGIDTLATRIYESASIGQFEQASLKSLIMLAISAVAVILVVGRQIRVQE